MRLNPSNTEARFDLEDFCISAPWIVGGSKDEAREQVEAISALDAVDGHVARGKFDLEGIKRPDLAENEFLQVLSAKPSRMQPYLEAIAFFERQNNLAYMDTAIKAAAQVDAKNPSSDVFPGRPMGAFGAESAPAEEYLKSYLAGTPERKRLAAPCGRA